MLKCKASGPRTARIMIVGEAPGREEEGREPFIGESGKELTRILHDAGIARTECFLTNVARYKPPSNDIRHFFHDGFTKSGKGTGTMRSPKPEILEGIGELEQEIREVQPNVIIAFGNTPLWALQNRPSAKAGIADWRGSELSLAERLATRQEPVGHSCIVIPTYHPAAVLRSWNWRALVVHDLRTRVGKYKAGGPPAVPPYRFQIRPSFPQVMERLKWLLDQIENSGPEGFRIANDIETGRQLISCIGLAWSKLDAICIPFRCIERPEGYWTIDEEVAIVVTLQEVLTHPKVRVVGQNFLYDAQYEARYLGFVPRVRDDTMLQQHVAYAGMEKGLDFLSSLYCEYHKFWKHEGKEFGNYKTGDEQDRGWEYNCKDAVITFECCEALDGALNRLGLRPQYEFQMELWHHVLRMMLRGVEIDKGAQKHLAEQLIEAMLQRSQEIDFVAGHPLNPRSPKQMQALFYHDLGFSPQYARKKAADGSRSVTLDEEALQLIARKEPLLRDFIRSIVEYRSLGVYLSTFVQARLGPDGRMRCYFNPGGTETYRFSSSEDAFGSGTNLQNLPRGLEDEAEIDITELVQYKLPNIRRLFKPDPGYTIGEVDLAGADAQVVAWESGDEVLKQIFREKRKLHVENGKLMYGDLMGPSGKREPYYTRVKIGVHLTNYGGSASVLSKSLHITMQEAEKFQQRWFQIHKPILKWHEQVEAQLQATRQVRNKFGYRRYYFDRIDGLLKEALAWVPQSTVALTANTALVHTNSRQIVEQEFWAKSWLDPEIDRLRAELERLGFQMLLQVHDSLVFQYPTRNEASILPLLYRAIRVRIPYEDPLIIPWGLKTSTKSWGDAEERQWPTEIKEALLALPQQGGLVKAWS